MKQQCLLTGAPLNDATAVQISNSPDTFTLPNGFYHIRVFENIDTHRPQKHKAPQDQIEELREKIDELQGEIDELEQENTKLQGGRK